MNVNWIDIKERMPEANKRVLIKDKDNWIRVAINRSINYGTKKKPNYRYIWENDSACCNEELWESDYPLFWMALKDLL